MLRHYLTVTFRFLSGNIIYIFFSMLCIGLALAWCIVAYINYTFDAGFDMSHEKADRIFRVEHKRLVENQPTWYSSSPITLYHMAKQDLSGIEMSVRIDLGSADISPGQSDELFNIKIAYADPEFFDIFTYPLTSGDKSLLKEKNSIYISERLADVLYTSNNPLNEIVYLMKNPNVFNQDQPDEFPLIVRGVLKNPPLNSSFDFDAVVPISKSFRNYIFFDENNWKFWSSATFFLLDDAFNIEDVEAQLQTYVEVVNDINDYVHMTEMHLTPLAEIAHNRDKYDHQWGYIVYRPPLPPYMVHIPLLAAAILMVFACFNFINMSIAFSGKKLTEIGIRKVYGSSRSALVYRFLIENFLLVFISFMVGILVAYKIIPVYSRMWPFIDLEFNLFGRRGIIWFIIFMLILTTFMAGAYPALFLSNFHAISIFRKNIQLKGKNMVVSILIALQFGIALCILLAGLIFVRNARFLENMDLGYDANKIFYLELQDPENGATFMNAIKDYHNTEGTCTYFEFFWNFDSISYQQTKRGLQWYGLGSGCFQTVGFRLIEGREFKPEFESVDLNRSIIVTESFVESFDISDPIGETVYMNDTVALRIIGVIEDFYFWGVNEKMMPTWLILTDKQDFSFLILRLDPENLEQDMQFMRTQWNKYRSSRDYAFVMKNLREELFEESIRVNRNYTYISLFFMVLTVVLSFVSLYIQISLAVRRRAKEMAIRKVFGSSFHQNFILISRGFIPELVIGSVAGVLLGKYLIVIILKSIWVYYTDIPLIYYLLPLVFIFTISILTIWVNVFWNMVRRPSEALRYE